MTTRQHNEGVPLTFWLGSLLSRAIPASFFAYKCLVFLQDFLDTGRWTSLAWIVSEGIVVLLFIIRRPSQDVSRRPVDWVAAIAGTLVMMLVTPSANSLIPAWLGLGLQMSGVCLQVSAKLVLGRSFGAVPANRGVVVRGPYRLVRHPMYLGYLISHVGFLLTNFSVRNLLIYALGYTFQIYRILAEEKFLGRDQDYRDYSRRVSYRLLPGLF